MISINSKELAYISLRVLSIYIFIQALLILSQIISLSVYNSVTFANFNEGIDISKLDLIFGGISPFVMLISLSIILWVFTDRISNYLLPALKDAGDRVEIAANLDEIQHIAFSIIGVIILAYTLPQTFNMIPNIIRINEIYPGYASSQYKTDLILSIIGYVVKLLIGLGLIFGSKGLTGILNRIRELGR